MSWWSFGDVFSQFVVVVVVVLSAVTPSDPACRVPQEFMEGEAGFSLLFPVMEGVQIRPFHFCKKSLSDSALEQAGKNASYPEQTPAVEI